MTEDTTQVESNDENAHDAHSDRPSYDDVNTPVILLIGVISALVTYMTIAFVEGLCYQWTNAQIQRSNYDVQNVRQAQLIQSQKDKVTQGPKDDFLPLNEATANVLERYSSGQTHGESEETGDDGHDEEGHDDAETHDDAENHDGEGQGDEEHSDDGEGH